MCHNNLTCYWPVPLQFAWKDLRTVIFELAAGHWYDRSMPYMFGIYCICLFWDRSFRKSGLLSNTTPRFMAGADGFASWPRIEHGKIFKIVSRWRLIPMRIKYVLLGLSFSLDFVIQVDTVITQCCNFSRDSFALEKRIETWKFEYHRHRDGGLCQNCR